MDQNAAPLVAALADYHRRDRYGFSPPGHRQGWANNMIKTLSPQALASLDA